MVLSAAPPPEPRPLHNRDGTLRSLARQMLADLDRDSLETRVPTQTLELLLNRLCEVLTTDAAPGPLRQAPGGLIEATSNPNLAYWQRRSDLDAERPDDE